MQLNWRPGTYDLNRKCIVASCLNGSTHFCCFTIHYVLTLENNSIQLVYGYSLSVSIQYAYSQKNSRMQYSNIAVVSCEVSLFLGWFLIASVQTGQWRDMQTMLYASINQSLNQSINQSINQFLTRIEMPSHIS